MGKRRRSVGPSGAYGSIESSKSGPTLPLFGPTPSPRELAARALEETAAAGDVRAIRLLAGGAAERLRSEPHSDEPVDGMAPHVAAAMIEAGLRAEEGGEGWRSGYAGSVDCPHCSGRVNLMLSGTYKLPEISILDHK